MAASARKRFLAEYPSELQDDTGAVFIGAGVSMGAGYPSWSQLLVEIGDDLGVKSTDVHDLAALAQWSIREHGGATRVRGVIRKEIGVTKPVPATVEIIARLPLRHLWTTNYDRLVERAFEALNRPLDVISSAKDLAVKARPGAARLYKMHGSVDRLDDLVISTDDYELYRSTHGAFLPLLQAHLTSLSMLFIGLSFTDPNIRHVLSLIRESFTDAPPEHFAIVRPPQEDDYSTADEYKAKLAQHTHWAKDLQRYGLSAIEIEEFAEVPDLLEAVEKRVAQKRVWISGSMPLVGEVHGAGAAYELSEKIGQLIGSLGLTLVTGAGVLVGSASLSGFLTSLRAQGSWDLERRLIARPFPQPKEGNEPEREKWTALREEMARLAGIVIIVGGIKQVKGDLVSADGVFEEAELAQGKGAFLLPVGAMGGAAKVIAERLVGSPLEAVGRNAARPTDAELKKLADAHSTPAALIELIEKIVRRVADV